MNAPGNPVPPRPSILSIIAGPVLAALIISLPPLAYMAATWTAPVLCRWWIFAEGGWLVSTFAAMPINAFLARRRNQS